jgi:hypothetical protein
MQLAGDRGPLFVDRDPGELLALAFGGGRARLELAPVAPLRLGVGAQPPDADDERDGDDRAERRRGLPTRSVCRSGGERRGDRGRERKRRERDAQLAERGGGVERDQHRRAARIAAERHDCHRRRECRREHGQWHLATHHERAPGDDREHEHGRPRRPRSTDHLGELCGGRDQRERDVERERAPAVRPALVEAH